MIGYDLVTPGDFNSYFRQCTAFQYLKGKIIPWKIRGVSTDEFHDYAKDCRCYLEEYCESEDDDDNDKECNQKKVLCKTLFNSPEWIIYRFQLGYIPILSNSLIHLSCETNERRMRKGTDITQGTFRGILFDESNYDQETFKVMSHLAIHRSSFPSYTDIIEGISKVLSYGNSPSMRRLISTDKANSLSYMDIRDMLLEKKPENTVVVPSFEIACVKQEGKTNTAIVIYNGRMLGQLGLSNSGSTITLTIPHKNYTDKETENIAMFGIQALCVPMIADRIDITKYKNGDK